MIFIEEKKLKEACHCSHLVVFVCSIAAPSFHLASDDVEKLSPECFIKTGFLSAALV